jgi:phosphoglycolate phosphatase-like HAD superfamily hydrolase
MNALLEITGGAELFDRTTSSADAARSKPDPDIVQAALDKARSSASESLMLGRYTLRHRGCRRCRRSRRGPLLGRVVRHTDLRGAIAIYDDAADLLARYDASPSGGSRN